MEELVRRHERRDSVADEVARIVERSGIPVEVADARMTEPAQPSIETPWLAVSKAIQVLRIVGIHKLLPRMLTFGLYEAASVEATLRIGVATARYAARVWLPYDISDDVDIDESLRYIRVRAAEAIAKTRRRSFIDWARRAAEETINYVNKRLENMKL